ncbi:MAG: hypothetical protein J7M15_01845 [Anaerolineae bacterium]|nr:hypothetical protein [Anaerolineae bacterium]
MGARHDRTHEEAPQVLGSSREGLTTAEATARRGRHDLNQLQERPSRNHRLVFLNQFAETIGCHPPRDGSLVLAVGKDKGAIDTTELAGGRVGYGLVWSTAVFVVVEISKNIGRHREGVAVAESQRMEDGHDCFQHRWA